MARLVTAQRSGAHVTFSISRLIQAFHKSRSVITSRPRPRFPDIPASRGSFLRPSRDSLYLADDNARYLYLRTPLEILNAAQKSRRPWFFASSAPLSHRYVSRRALNRRQRGRERERGRGKEDGGSWCLKGPGWLVATVRALRSACIFSSSPRAPQGK